MKKSIAILALGILCLSFGAHMARADRPVAPESSTVWMVAPSHSAAFTDGSLTPDPSATHEVVSHGDLAEDDRALVDRYQWVNRLDRSSESSTSPQSVPEPSALLLLVCGCLGLAPLGRKLSNPNL
jgi:hypothetical protein